MGPKHWLPQDRVGQQSWQAGLWVPCYPPGWREAPLAFLLGPYSRPLAHAHVDACEYVTRATRERLISFLFLANRACQQLPAPNPRGQKRKHKRGCIFRHVPGLHVSAPTSGRILLLSITSMAPAEALRQGKKRPRERPLPPGWRREEGQGTQGVLPFRFPTALPLP